MIALLWDVLTKNTDLSRSQGFKLLLLSVTLWVYLSLIEVYYLKPISLYVCI